ncbi:Formation of crista junctions protein 1 [Allomyces javanicus]|nr:Formation of crista junctions protein 1 [Allomyces javanicus]
MSLLRLTSRALRPAAARARPVPRGVRALATTPSTDDAAKPAAQDAATPAPAAAAPAAAAAAAAPKIAKPDEEPDAADDKPLFSPVKRVLYSGLFLAAIGVTGTIYHAAHDDTFRGSLKQSVPFLPWDWLAYETQVVESTVSHMVEEAEHVVEHMVEEAEHIVEHMVEEAEHIVEEVEHMAEDVVKEAKKEMWHVAEESVSPAPSPKPAKRSSSRAIKSAPAPAAAEAIAAPAPTPAVAVVPVVPVVAAAAPAPRSLSAEIDAAVARAETDTSAAPADPAKRPLGRSKAIDSLQHSLNRLNAIFSALAQTAPEVRPSVNKIKDVLRSAEQDLDVITTQLDALTDEQNVLAAALLEQQAAEFAASLEKHEAHLRAQFAAREAALVDEANRSVEAVSAKATTDLHQHEAQWAAQTQAMLQQQATELEATWRRQVQDKLDHERNGRLARLDHLHLKLKYLEKMCKINTEKLHKSYHIHSMYSALQALQTTLFEDRTGTAPRTPFKSQWDLLYKLSLNDPLVTAVLDSVSEEAQTQGIASFPELHVRFTQAVAPEVRHAAMLPTREQSVTHSLVSLLTSVLPARENGDSLLAIPQARATDVPPVGFVSYSLSRALSALLIPKAPGLYKENDMESVLARVEYHLQREDLDAATRELNALTGWPKRLVQGWLKEARRYLEVKMAMDVLQTQVGLQSLGAV